MTNAVSAALAETRAAAAPDAPPRTPAALINRNKTEFTSVLPTHIQGPQGEAWVRLTLGSLKTGKLAKDGSGRYELEVAAMNNPVAFMQACRKAASMGLQPGTEQYYMTPVRNSQNQGRTEILGIVGYKGYIELMYRGGHVASVIVQTVHEGEEFEFVQGRDVMPMHRVNWRAKRGALELVYAYAKMHSGAVSNVVILNEDDIEHIRSKSASAKYDNSPWNTDTRAMWLKSAVRRLQTWVPWSVEIHGVGGVPILPAPVIGAPSVEATPSVPQIQATGAAAQITDGVAKLQNQDPDQQVIDAELVEPPLDEAPPEEPSAGTDPGEPQMSKPQLRKMQALFGEKGFKDSDARHAFVNQTLGVKVTNSGALTVSQAVQVIDALEKLAVPTDVPSDGPAGD